MLNVLSVLYVWLKQYVIEMIKYCALQANNTLLSSDPSGLVAQLVEHSPGKAEVLVSIPS